MSVQTCPQWLWGGGGGGGVVQSVPGGYDHPQRGPPRYSCCVGGSSRLSIVGLWGICFRAFGNSGWLVE